MSTVIPSYQKYGWMYADFNGTYFLIDLKSKEIFRIYNNFKELLRDINILNLDDDVYRNVVKEYCNIKL